MVGAPEDLGERGSTLRPCGQQKLKGRPWWELGAPFWKLGEARGAGMKGVKRWLSKEQSQGLQDLVDLEGLVPLVAEGGLREGFRIF